MIVTDDGDFAERLRCLRQQGMSKSAFARDGMSPSDFETYPEIGFNFRMTDIQAAIGRVQLSKIDEILERRRTIARRYQTYLKDHPAFLAPYVPDGLEPNWQTFQIGIRPETSLDRNAIMDRLHEHGVPTRRGVMASHLEPPYKHMHARLPKTEQANSQNLQLPLHPALSQEQQESILNALDEVTEQACQTN